MQKLTGFAAWLILGAVVVAGGTFTNTGSASWPCQVAGDGFVQEHAIGTIFNFACPPGTSPTGSGSASVGNLSAQANMFIQGLPITTFSLQSTFTDSLLPLGGTGSGMVEFTLTYSFSGLIDLGGAQGDVDLLFNGVQVDKFRVRFCDAPPQSPACLQYTQPQQIVKVIDEPIIYGVPFSYQADDALSGQGGLLYSLSNGLAVSTSLPTGGSWRRFQNLARNGYAWLGHIKVVEGH